MSSRQNKLQVSGPIPSVLFNHLLFVARYPSGHLSLALIASFAFPHSCLVITALTSILGITGMVHVQLHLMHPEIKIEFESRLRTYFSQSRIPVLYHHRHLISPRPYSPLLFFCILDFLSQKIDSSHSYVSTLVPCITSRSSHST
jgi:hypothetical protein